MSTRVSSQRHTPSEVESSVSDDTLVQWLRSGNDGAASRLYSRYVDRLRALARAKLSADLCRRVDAEDIVQSVFRRFFQAARQGNYDAPAGDDLWGLLLVITLNKIRSEKSYQRAAKRDVRRTIDPGNGFSLEQIAERGDVADALLRLHVEEALARLPADYRAVVELRMEGHEVQEIAQQTGRSKRTVERILQESRQALRHDLNETD
jgi:RNA polymerase sigma-70 factor (ECF subfamily)